MPPQTMSGQAQFFARLDRALDGYGVDALAADAPVAVIDLDALDANAADLTRRAGSVPVRVASKSVRCTAVLRRVLQRPGFRGILAYSLAEAIHLVRAGVSDDVVVAYPTTQRTALTELVGDHQLTQSITLMVDHPDQLAWINHHTPRRSTAVRICLDMDCSLRLGPVHLGARRSPLRTVEQAQTAVEHILSLSSHGPRFQLVGVMGYEAQIAGMTDSSPAVRLMKKVSVGEVAARRGAVVHAVEQALQRGGQPPLEFVNGGGTGSVETTVAESAVTEVAAGSGLYCPHLFDHYRQFAPRPAAFFGVDVVRHPAPQIATVFGGGWVASGAVGPDRWPVPVWPEGLTLLPSEGAGEVQTPLRCRGLRPEIGSRVWMRHTKAGELCEHINVLHLLQGNRIVATVPTYRGERKAF